MGYFIIRISLLSVLLLAQLKELIRKEKYLSFFHILSDIWLKIKNNKKI